MARVQFIVDGEAIYDGELPGYESPRPDMIGDDLRAGLNPQAPLAPWQKNLLLAMLGKGLVEQLARHPKLQPLKASIDVRAGGWSLHVDVPEPGPDEVMVVDAEVVDGD